MHINHPKRKKHGQKDSIFGALEVAPGVFLWSRFMVKKNARPPVFNMYTFPHQAHLTLRGQGHAHLRIIGHVLNRWARPLRGRDPTILKQRTGVKEMRVASSLIHINTHTARGMVTGFNHGDQGELGVDQVSFSVSGESKQCLSMLNLAKTQDVFSVCSLFLQNKLWLPHRAYIFSLPSA